MLAGQTPAPERRGVDPAPSISNRASRGLVTADENAFDRPTWWNSIETTTAPFANTWPCLGSPAQPGEEASHAWEPYGSSTEIVEESETSRVPWIVTYHVVPAGRPLSEKTTVGP